MTPLERAPSPGDDQAPIDAGMTLVEVLVAMTLFGVFSTVLLGFALSTLDVSDRVEASADRTQEARLVVERMSRELRQARGLDGVTTSGGAVTGMTLRVDFDGNGVIDTTAADPEVLTYRWDATSGDLTLTANDADGTAITRPVLAGGVTGFDIRLRSSQWAYDANADGTTSWQEIDESSVGNRSSTPDGPELALVDLVSVRLTVLDGERPRVFTLQADLRNRDVSHGGTP